MLFEHFPLGTARGSQQPQGAFPRGDWALPKKRRVCVYYKSKKQQQKLVPSEALLLIIFYQTKLL
jgi:hypothetical protein